MKAISYSLFGYDAKRYDGCFDFNSYLRGIYINIRLARLLFPDWQVVVNVDEQTNDKFHTLFSATPNLNIVVNKRDALCKMMLWRMKPIFEVQEDKWKYTHVLCRDTDSPLTYKEALCVNNWLTKDKCLHAMADSISHTVPLMGGMIGIQVNGFTSRTGYTTFADLFQGTNIDYSVKGSDQDFLNRHIYPKFAKHGEDSITQHYFLGMPNTFLSDWHNSLQDKDIGLNEYKDLTPPNICGHVGSAGYYNDVLYRELRKFNHKFEDIKEAEKMYPEIFSWLIEKSL